MGFGLGLGLGLGLRRRLTLTLTLALTLTQAGAAPADAWKTDWSTAWKEEVEVVLRAESSSMTKAVNDASAAPSAAQPAPTCAPRRKKKVVKQVK